MRRANKLLGGLSFVLGGSLIFVSLLRGGFVPSLGILFGFLLAFLGLLRLWLAFRGDRVAE